MHNDIDLGVLEGMALVGAMIGVLGPIMAIGWGKATSRRPIPPMAIKIIWLFFGTLGVSTVIAGIFVALFHIHV